MPAAVEAATRDYRASMDVIGAFLDACCVLGEDLQVPAADLYRKYASWCEANEDQPAPKRTFGVMMGERGLRGRTMTWQGKKCRVYLGVDLDG